LFYFSFSL